MFFIICHIQSFWSLMQQGRRETWVLSDKLRELRSIGLYCFELLEFTSCLELCELQVELLCVLLIIE